MALNIINIDEIKRSELDIINAKKDFDTTLQLLKNTFKETEFFWQGEDANLYREKNNALIDKELNDTSLEMNYEINYLNKVSTVLKDAQEQVKNRLNS